MAMNSTVVALRSAKISSSTSTKHEPELHVADSQGVQPVVAITVLLEEEVQITCTVTTLDQEAEIAIMTDTTMVAMEQEVDITIEWLLEAEVSVMVRHPMRTFLSRLLLRRRSS